jgi:hypothetical protein
MGTDARRKILCLFRGSNPGRPVCSQTLYWLSYSSSSSPLKIKEYIICAEFLTAVRIKMFCSWFWRRVHSISALKMQTVSFSEKLAGLFNYESTWRHNPEHNIVKLPAVLYCHGSCFLTLVQECSLRVHENGAVIRNRWAAPHWSATSWYQVCCEFL